MLPLERKSVEPLAAHVRDNGVRDNGVRLTYQSMALGCAADGRA